MKKINKKILPGYSQCKSVINTEKSNYRGLKL